MATRVFRLLLFAPVPALLLTAYAGAQQADAASITEATATRARATLPLEWTTPAPGQAAYWGRKAPANGNR